MSWKEGMEMRVEAGLEPQERQKIKEFTLVSCLLLLQEQSGAVPSLGAGKENKAIAEWVITFAKPITLWFMGKQPSS